MSKKKIVKILKEMEVYYLVISYMLIALFISITGTTILPLITKIAAEGSLVPLFYTLSIMFGFMYFGYYKVAKLIFNKFDKKQNDKT